MMNALYDLEAGPITFDSAVFFALAEAQRVFFKEDGIRVLIAPARGGGFRMKSKRDRIFDDARKAWRLWNVVVPMARLLPSVSGVSVLTGREEIGDLGKTRFPSGWSEERPTCFYQMVIAKAAHAAGMKLQSFRASDAARRWADALDGRIVTITLRESDYQPGRNSDLAEWRKVAGDLSSRGYRVIVVPDTEAVMAGRYSTLDCETSLPAAFNLDLRCALYERAALNLHVSGGPAALGLFNRNIAQATFRMVNTDYQTTSPAWLAHIGLPVGSELPWLQPWQRTVWADDTADVVIETVDDLMRIEKAAA